MADAFGRAVLDHHRTDRTDPLLFRNGDARREHPIESFYFEAFDPECDAGAWLSDHVDGPLVDLGAGAGRHALHFQADHGVVALEPSEHLVETIRDRGVANARQGDMFALRELFGANRFRSAIAIGTQTCLAASMQGLRQFLADLAYVTTADATVVLDGYDPSRLADGDLLGYRPDPAPGLAHRVAWFEYGDMVGDALLFRLFGPDRFREAAAAAGWELVDLQRPYEPHYYRVALVKL